MIKKNIYISLLAIIAWKLWNFMVNKGFFGGVFHMKNKSSLSLISNKFIGNEALLGGVLNFVDILKYSLQKNTNYILIEGKVQIMKK